MKRVIVALLTVLLAVGTTGCGEESKKEVEFVSEEWQGITFQIPESWEWDEDTSNDEAVYYKKYNDDKDVVETLYITRNKWDKKIDDNVLAGYMSDIHSASGVRNIGEIQDVNVNMAPAKKSTYSQKVGDIDYKMMTYLFPLGDYVIRFTFGTQNDDFSDFERTIDSIHFEVQSEKKAVEEKSKKPTSKKPAPTEGEANALDTAHQYLSVLPFSHSKLIEQLKYEGFTDTEATYAADNCGANWNEQAKRAAQSYLDTMSLSRYSLIDQLIYEGFTPEQAEYGVSAVGY